MDLTRTEVTIRSRMFRLLADCFLEPEPRLADTVSEMTSLIGGEEGELTFLVQEMSDYLKTEGALENLVVDHARLFVGPFSLLAPPYGSVYLEENGQVMGESTMAAREYYLAEGLDTVDGFTQPPDHITVELEFLHYLTTKQMEASSINDQKKAGYLRGREASFVEEQIEPWLGNFVDLVCREAETEFYISLAKLTAAALCVDMGRPVHLADGSETKTTTASPLA